jgi:hydroxymethylpyrimidine pyrophosphatase-like HAD family hydrolase
MIPFSLISTDFDGTVVCSTLNPPFPRELGVLIRQLQRDGVYWAINTGRTLPLAEDGLVAYGEVLEPDFLITSEREIFRRSAAGGWEDYGDWNARCTLAHKTLFGAARDFFDAVREYFRKHPDHGEIITVEGVLEGVIARDVEAMEYFIDWLENCDRKVPGLSWQRNHIYLRFCEAGYDKGTALKGLADLLGITRERIFAAGDNFNDISMLDGKIAAYVACPRNAIPEVKEAVRKASGYVSEGHAGLGVADALRYFCYGYFS